MKNKQLTSIIRFLIFLGIGLGILYYVYYSTNQSYQLELEAQGLPAQDYLVKLRNDMASANYFWIGLVILAFLASNLSRAIRWKMLLDPLKQQKDGTSVQFYNPLLGVLVGYVVNLVIPRAGEVAKCGVIAQYEGISLDKVLGTAVLDRILDVICLFLMILLALALEFDMLWGYLSTNVFQSDSGTGLPSWLIIVGAVGVTGVLLLFLFRKRVQQLAIYKKIENLIIGFVEGLRSIQKLKNPVAFIGHTIFIWLMYYLMLYLAFFSFAPTAGYGPVTGLLVFVFGAMGMVIPSPGGIGSYQYLVKTALNEFYGLIESDALSFANIAFTAPFLCNIIFGVVAFILLPVLNRRNKGLV